MRILGFSKHWDKLKQPEFSTYRLPRKDKDWEVGEVVQVVYKPCSKEREILGQAAIIYKGTRIFKTISEQEAIADGFPSAFQMWLFLKKINMDKILNKLTLYWIERNARPA